MMTYFTEDPAALPLIPMCLTFLPFAVINVYSNYRSSHYVTTSSLNVPRAETVFYSVLKESVIGKEGLTAVTQQQLERFIPTPKYVAHAEVFVRRYRSPFSIDLDIEPAVSRYTGQGDGPEGLNRALRQLDFVQAERYYIMLDETTTRGTSKVVLWFDKQATESDLIQGFFHACAARLALERINNNKNNSTAMETGYCREWSKVISLAHKQAIETVPRVVEVMDQQGWDTTSLFLTDGDLDRIQLQ
jgi:hypothetical protein